MIHLNYFSRINRNFKKNGITATITGREKTPFSIWRKIQNKKISLRTTY